MCDLLVSLMTKDRTGSRIGIEQCEVVRPESNPALGVLNVLNSCEEEREVGQVDRLRCSRHRQKAKVQH